MAQYTLHGGKVKFGSLLSREAWALKMNISDMYYVYDMNKDKLNPGDKSLMLCTIKSMVKSHKRMLRQLIKDGEYIGDPKEITYRTKINIK